MPFKPIDQAELDNLYEWIANHKEGVSVGQVCQQFNYVLKTGQRRLGKLVKARRIFKIGKSGSNVRYTAQQPINSITPAWDSVPDKGASYQSTEIKLSSEAQDIRAIVSAPIANRRLVGYQRQLLDQYQPNKSFYLPESVRQHLHKIGEVPNNEQVAGTYARHILSRLLIDLSWNSSRLEGNTYSLLETELLILKGEQSEGKEAFETQMVLNHKAAIEFLVEQAEDVGFNNYTITNLHALLSDNLLPNPEACGRLRSMPVQIGGSVYTPLAVPQLIEEIFNELLEKANKIKDPFEQSFFAMVHLSYLQAFDDVNKRVARLASNIPLIRHNLCPLSFIDMPKELYIEGLLGVYELNRVDLLIDVFVWSYERSVARYAVVQQSLGEPDKFKIKYRDFIRDTITQIIRDGLSKKASISLIRERADMLDNADRARFIEVIDKELLGLHKGNSSRYRVRPSEFDRWTAQW